MPEILKSFESPEDIVKQTKTCYQKMDKCLGDSGDIKCFFCPACVMSEDERAYNLRMWIIQVYNSKKSE